jgi:hypothetical protein
VERQSKKRAWIRMRAHFVAELSLLGEGKKRKAGLSPGLSNTYYEENNSLKTPDAAPQTCAKPATHGLVTAYLHR